MVLQPAKPIFCVPQGDTCTALNFRGQVMKADPKDLTEIVRLGAIPAGKKQEKVVELTLALLKAIDAEVKNQIAQVDYSASGQFMFHLKNGITVNWGISEKNEMKAKILKVLMMEKDKKHFDISMPEAPVAS
ncbi:cell division protein FtsQ/DivIB [Arcanobacterium hippocoleae]